MADLRTLFVAFGSEDVSTYLQSGNVVFKSSVDSPAQLIETIQKRINHDLGLSVKVLLRTKAHLKKTVAGNPFANGRRELTKLHVTFLAERPDGVRVGELEAKDFEPDEFRIVGPEIYLHCPNGYGRSKLTNAYFEKELGVAATTRNWKTVTKLAELVGG
jgi:uncharacterized protein (DUF1697 family)